MSVQKVREELVSVVLRRGGVGVKSKDRAKTREDRSLYRLF